MTIDKTNGNADDQNHSDDTEDIDAILRDAGIELDDDGHPVSGTGDISEQEKRQRHAFAVLKRQAKAERDARIKAEQKADEVLKVTQTNNSGATQLPTSGSGSQATILMRKMKEIAAAELGIDNPSTPDEIALVNAHTTVVYQRLIAKQEATTKAESQSGQFVEQELAKYDLSDEDVAEVRKRVNSMSPLDRMNGNRIKSEVAGYLGEKFLNGDMSSSASTEDGTAGAPDAASRRAAVSSTLARGGVRLGVKTKNDSVKPATSAELAEMKRVGISDVKLYREAKARSSAYID